MQFFKNVSVAKDLYSIYGDIKEFQGSLEKTGNGFYYANDELEMQTELLHHETGVCKRRDSVTNVSSREITLSGAQAKFVFSGGEYEVYTQYSEWCAESRGAWQPLVTEVCAANDDTRMNTGSVPFVAIYNLQTQRGVAFHILAESKWSFRVKKRYSQTGQRKTVTVELGIHDGNFAYKLKPGETLKLPDILFYEFFHKTDMDAYNLHRYCNEVMPARSLPVIYNSWMSKFDNISYDILSEQLEKAKELGAEYFVIDAGWFGKPNEWFDSVGDWEECTDASMAGRMKEFADKVRAEGLKFGIWFEIERAAKASKAVKEFPQHYFYEGGNYFVNFAAPETCDYIFEAVARIVRRYGVEFIKFDHNAEISYDSSGRAFIDYFKGYNGFIRRLGKEFPTLYLQNCASGGLRMAMGALKGFDSFWMSDNHSLYAQLEIFKNTMLRMPSRALERWITIRSYENFEPLYGGGRTEKILVSGDAGWGHMEAVNESFLRGSIFGGPIGISCDLTKISDKVFGILKEEIESFKSERDFWINSECRILCDTPSLLILQFSDYSMSNIKVFTYLKVPHQNEVTVYPKCSFFAQYEVAGKVVSGEALFVDGYEIKLGDRYTSQSVTFKEIVVENE